MYPEEFHQVGSIDKIIYFKRQIVKKKTFPSIAGEFNRVKKNYVPLSQV